MRVSAGIGGALMCAGLFFAVSGELPPELPGSEIRHEDLIAAIPKDTAANANVQKPSTGEGGSLFEQEEKTWDAPPLSEQMGGAESFVPIGKGGIFVPRFTASTSEPEVLVLDSTGHTVISGNPGRTFSVEPGVYTVVLGSGVHKQRIIRKVTVEEGKTVPVMPDWSGLSIETVDSLGAAFRGQYELTRIDEFEAYGQGYGAHPELGEVVKTWILKPGVYKILGVGESYNSLTGFVTVRLFPGELCRFLLVQDSTDNRILGGGTVDVTPQSKRTSAWQYGGSIGGSVKFNATLDQHLGDTITNTDFGLISSFWLTYRKQPYEWQTHVRLNEGFNFSGFSVDNLQTDVDEFLLNSLFIWRLVSWLGPYANTQLLASFMPVKLLRTTPYLCILNKNGALDSTTAFNTSQTFRLKPPFSSVLLNFGAGLNADAINFPFLEAKIRGGFGGSFSYFPNQFQIGDTTSIVNFTSLDTATKLKVGNSVLLDSVPAASEFGIGPQAAISGLLRLGKVITADGELDVFAPVAPEYRLFKPDYNIISTISWRLYRWITLDYSYTYQRQQPANVNAQVNKTTYGVWLRFSFSSR
jgi:hypothetical protein